MGNLIKTSMLLAAMTALFMGVGYMIGGQTGMLMALVFAAGTNIFGWWNSGNMVLRIHGAEEVDETSAPELVSMVRQLAERAELPMPKVYVIDTRQPNAFATGRNPQNAAVAASAGLLDALSREEVAAVMAHELAHIKSRDTLTMTITATIAGAISMLTNFAFFFRGRNNPFGFIGMMAAMILAPLAAGIVQMAISRTREYQADKDGAIICGNPLWLASALEKISAMSGQVVNQQAENAPATAHMFIINPLNGQRADPLFSTHPAPENRIAALQTLHDEWNSRPPVDVVTSQGHQAEREIFGRNAGQLRPSDPNDDVSAAGPWNNTSSHKRGPWQ